MICLIDTNVLIALVDHDHPHNAAATAFFKQAMIDGWATCPLTENGFLRILGHPNYNGLARGDEEAPFCISRRPRTPLLAGRLLSH